MIEAIAIAIAVLGAVLLLILFARIRAVDAELKLKKHRVQGCRPGRSAQLRRRGR
jgi:hypothetical protein